MKVKNNERSYFIKDVMKIETIKKKAFAISIAIHQRLYQHIQALYHKAWLSERYDRQAHFEFCRCNIKRCVLFWKARLEHPADY